MVREEERKDFLLVSDAHVHKRIEKCISMHFLISQGIPPSLSAGTISTSLRADSSHR